MMANALIKYETIGDQQIRDIMAGREPQPPADWQDTGGAAPQGGKARPEPDAPGAIGGPEQHRTRAETRPGRPTPSL